MTTGKCSARVSYMHKFKNVNGYRSEKNTHISMVSNSVRHLRSYTNTAIANIDRNSVPGTDIAMPSASIVVLSTNVTAGALNADVTALSTDVPASSADIVTSNGECLSVS